MPRTIAILFRAPLAVLVLLGGCTSHGHFESQQELSQLYKQLVAAEERAWASTEKPFELAAAVSNVETSGDLSMSVGLPGARFALAQAALNDAQDAVSDPSIGTQDKISILYRAAIKGWHAGNAWDANTGFSIDDKPIDGSPYGEFRGRIDAGIKDCGSLPELQKPQRDCMMLSISDQLTKLEVAASNITDLSIQIRRENMRREKRQAVRPDWDYAKMMTGLSRQVSTIKAAFGELNGTGLERGGVIDPSAPDLSTVVSIQRFAYYCHATRAVFLLSKIPEDSNGKLSGKSITNLQRRFQTADAASLVPPTQEISQIFSGQERLLVDLVGSHNYLREIVYADVKRINPSADINALKPGSDTSLVTRRTLCEGFFRQKTGQ